LKAATINRRLSCHSFFEYLASERIETNWPNPCQTQRHALKEGAHLPRDVHDNEADALLAAITEPRDRAMFHLMVGAGLRVGEVTSLLAENIEREVLPGELTRLRVHRQREQAALRLDDQRGVGKPARVASIRPAVKHGYVFVNQHGRPLTVRGIQYRLKAYADPINPEISCHRLRHTFARRLAEHGMPVESLAKLLTIGAS
jgi:integrase/recombinase XerC